MGGAGGVGHPHDDMHNAQCVIVLRVMQGFLFFFSEDSYSTRVKASTALTICHLLVKEGSTSRGFADLD